MNAAITALADDNAPEQLDQLLSDHADVLLDEVGAEAVLAAVAHVPDHRRSQQTWQLAGEAYQVIGQWSQATYCLRRAGSDDTSLTASLAWRVAWTHYLSGAPAEALAAADRCPMDGADPANESLLLTCMASAHWALGNMDTSVANAEAAIQLARKHNDDRAQARAYTVLAMLAAAKGDRATNATCYNHAVTHAERACDVLGMVRIRVNLSSHYVEEARYAEALAELEIALPVAQHTGFATYQALGLNNRGQARQGLGLLDEAEADLRAARDIHARTGSALAATALYHLGEVYEVRGDRTLARAAYEESIGLAETVNAITHLVPALAGLSRVLIDEEPDTAEDLLRRALEYGSGLGHVAALLAVSRLSLMRDDHANALLAAANAEKIARDRGDRAGIAESLELRALAARDRDTADRMAWIREAAGIWAEIGNPIGGIRGLLAQAVLLGDASGAVTAELAADRARKLGARGLARQADAVTRQCRMRQGLHITTLGGFGVARDTEPVPLTAWQSRKARDLVKILIARRGRPTTRQALCSMLWPDENPDQLGNRLAVALSLARGVLDQPRRCLITDADTVRLDIQEARVDVFEFLTDAQAGLSAWRHGDDAAAPLLAAAERTYTGDFLEEDPYAEWAVALRDEARLTYIQVAAALAEHALNEGDPGEASRRGLRILERDCYDEQAHLILVRALVVAGKHGEARRRYQLYMTRMAEIDVRPHPFPKAWPHS